MPRLLLALALLPLAAAAGGDFDRFLAAYRAADVAARGELARSFVEARRARSGFPIVEPGGDVVFLYFGTGDERAVHLLGDFRTGGPHTAYWDPQGEPMARAAPDAPLFFARRRFKEDARIEYQFLVDGERRADPLDPRTAASGIARSGAVETVSALVMPGYRVRPELAPREGVARGEVRVTTRPTWPTWSGWSPSLFRSLALLSPALSGPPSYWQPWFGGGRRPDPRLRVWLSAGSYEGSLHEDARTMAAYFRTAGVATVAVCRLAEPGAGDAGALLPGED